MHVAPPKRRLRLLAALSDRTFTRSLLAFETGHGQWRESYRPSRVRDAAIDLLDEIAGGGFRDENGGAFAFHPFGEEKWPEVAKRASAWWGVAKEKGEEGTLAAIVPKGGRQAVAPAKRMAVLFPGPALAAIRAGLAVHADYWGDAWLVDVAGTIPGEEATDFLLEVLAKEKRPRPRLSAATALLARRRREGIPASSPWRGGSGSSPRSSAGAARPRCSRSGPGPRGAVPRGGPRSLSDEAAKALEDLLGARLGDQSEVEDVWMDVGGTEVDGRVGHVAARVLAERFPERYAYDPRACAKEREEQRRTAQNAWRAKKGLPPVAPVAPRRPPLPERSVAPVLDRFLAAEGDEARDAAWQEAERLGLSFLPAIAARLRALPEGAKGRWCRGTWSSSTAPQPPACGGPP